MSGRQRSTFTATIADDGTKTDAIPTAGMVSGSVYLPTGFVGVALTFEVCDTQGGTFRVPYTAANAAVGIATVAATRAYPIPAQIFDWPFFKIVSGSSETGGPLSLLVSMNG